MSFEITKTNNAIELSQQELDTVTGGRIRTCPTYPYSPIRPTPIRPTPIRDLIDCIRIRPGFKASDSAE